MPRIWTQQEIQILTDAKNKKYVKVPNRSKKSVRVKLISLGLSKRSHKVKSHNKKRWTSEELKILYEAKNKLNIKIPGRTKYSILAKLSHLNIFKKQKPRKPWLKKEDKLLLRLLKEGKSAKDIFLLKVFPYSKNSIQKKICFLGLSKKRVGSKYLSDKNREIFKKFLQDNWQGKTPEDLLNLWNEINLVKVNMSKIIYYLNSMKIKIPYGEVAKINNMRKKEKKIKESLLSPKDLMESLRISRAKMMRKRISQNRDLWTGMPLSEDIVLELASFN